MTNTQKQEFTLKITQANKTGMIKILYEMILVYIEDAKNAYEKKDRKAFQEEIRKARGCFKELMSSVNLETNLGMKFLQLYIFMNKLLVRADIRYDIEPLRNVEKWIGDLHGAYVELEKKDTTGTVMENTQTIYAGLTYGKEALVESMSDSAKGRGYQA